MMRVVFRELKFDIQLVEERFWERREEFLKFSPAAQTPVIIHKTFSIVGIYATLEYLRECSISLQHEATERLWGKSIEQRSRVRCLVEWFHHKLHNEVTKHILYEKVIRVLSNGGAPNSGAIIIAKRNLQQHIAYINHLLMQNCYLTGDTPNIADYAAAAHISLLDFVADMRWNLHRVKEWYSLIKSRPFFRILLDDRVSCVSPPIHYSNPDF